MNNRDTTHSVTPDDLERLLLNGELRYTGDEVARETGVSIEDATALWRALGFANVEGEAAFTSADIAALRTLVEKIDAEVIDEATAVQMVRALGRMTGRLAEWHVETLASLIESDERYRKAPRLTSAYQVAQELLPAFEHLLVYAWRRKLAAAANRLVAVADAGASQLLAGPASVGFADLVSFTRLSRSMSVEAIGSLVEKFEALTNDVIFGHGGRVVKTLGDEVLFVANTPAVAVAIGFDLINEVGMRSSLPKIRVGIATGEVISRLGDVFGTPTNLAARLTDLAKPNTVLVDAATADDLSDTRDVVLRAMPPARVAGLGAVSSYTATRRASAH